MKNRSRGFYCIGARTVLASERKKKIKIFENVFSNFFEGHKNEIRGAVCCVE